MLFAKIKALINNFITKILHKGEASEHQYFIFSIFGFISYPFYYFIWVLTNSNSYENLTLRILASIFCIPLMIKNYLPTKLKRFLPIYWYLLLIYCVPFFFTFMLLKNNLSTLWLLNTMSALVWTVLIVDSLSLIVIILLGMPIGLCFYKLSEPAFYLPSNYGSYLFLFSSVIIFSILFSTKKEKFQKEKIETMRLLGASIAHELRTPFAALNLIASSMRKYFYPLVQGYELAKNNNLPVHPLTSTQIELLGKIPNTIEKESRSANLFIDLLIRNLSPSINEDTNKTTSISHCINEALNRYPFTEEEKELIKWNKADDFYFKGSDILVIHLLFNLIKNALYYLAKASNKADKEIHIWLEKTDTFNKLCFKDTGTGIAADILPYIFNRFFSRTDHGSGIGLTYCKMVMESLRGSISCESEINNYTLFIMCFPIVKT